MTPEQNPDDIRKDAMKRLVRPLRLTWAGLLAERVVRAFWPLWSVMFVMLAAVFFGLHESGPIEIVWAIAVLSVLAVVWLAYRGVRQFQWPTRDEAVERLDSSLNGRPLQALSDHQAIGSTDAASVAVWAEHIKRMAARTENAKAVEPDLRLAARDPYALRYVALTFLCAALLFGSIWRAATIAEVATGGDQIAATGPSWEGWVEPPAYTGKPGLYLNDIEGGTLSAPFGSQIVLRLYGAPGALNVDETVSARAGTDSTPASDSNQSFELRQDGHLKITGPGGRTWNIKVIPDSPPSIEFEDGLEREASGQMSQPFSVIDDYGVVAGQGRITLDLPAVARSYGLATAPEPREPLEFDLPMTISGDRAAFSETIVENFSKHPWAGLPVKITLSAFDDAGQQGESEPLALPLPGRRFFDPMAAALIEQRRDLLWTRKNAARVAQILRAVTHRPDDVLRGAGDYLKLRMVLRRLEMGMEAKGGLTAEVRDEVAEVLWVIALGMEEGDLSDALERLRRAQDRLSEAIRKGASDEEIAELMQELREAMQDYMNQLAQQSDPSDQQQLSENTMEITGDQLQELLDRLQQLMEEGRTAEAEALLEQLRQMMENMQVTQGQNGQGQQSPGQQAMEGLAESLREQQGLSDEAFQDLQEQFNPGQGQQQGQPGQNQGQNEGQGTGQNQDGQQGEQGQGQEQGSQPRPGEGGEPTADSLARRQGELRDELGRQQGSLPGAGTPEGDAAREALGRAGNAMDRAEDSLEQGDLAEAIDNQAEAMEALREGIRNLGEAMAQEQQRQQGQQGDQVGRANPNGQRDPLGRERGEAGSIGTEERLLQGEDVYRRARDLLDEIRRRSSEQDRPEVELDYLRRLLDRF